MEKRLRKKDTALKALIDILAPYAQQSRNKGEFLANLIECGLTGSGESVQELRALRTWKNYANGSDHISTKLAKELCNRWDIDAFRTNFMSNVEEDALNFLARDLHYQYPSINKGNVAEEVGVLFLEIFKESATTHSQTKTIPPATQPTRSRTPFIDLETHKLHLADDVIDVPAKIPVPDDIKDNEAVYIHALLHAYCENLPTVKNPTVADIPQRMKPHFDQQRQAFYDAEWVKETSWSSLDNDTEAPLFEIFLEAIEQGVIDINLLPYDSEQERLLSTLGQATHVVLDNVKLSQIRSLISPRCKKGACHELVNEGRLSWSA